MTDVRIAVSFRSHPKRIKLQKRLGAAGVLAFVDLMLFAAENKTSGVLSGMSAEDIAIAGQWLGDDQSLIDALIDVGLLEFDGSVYLLHDWKEHNPYAANWEIRSFAASKAAHVRWLKERAITCNKKGCTYCAAHAKSMRAASKRIAPSPTPSPTPSPDQKEQSPGPLSGSDEINFEKEFNSLFDHDFPRAKGRNVGRKDAQKSFRATVKTTADLADLRSALTNYKTIPDVRRGFVMRASRWFKEWRDYVNVESAPPSPHSGDAVRPDGIEGLVL